MMRKPVLAAVLAAGLFLAGCVSPSYYCHVSYHHLKIMGDREPVAKLIDRPDTSKSLREKLILTREIRSFAVRDLLLPDNDSYTAYTELNRPQLMWNVVATPELSLAPVTWHFLFAGRMSYIGFYDYGKAASFANGLKVKGYDVTISEVPAYSTLGWFDDPLLSSFIHWPEADLAALIFHELAHQKLYIKGDTAFNESFAEMVADEGLNRWFKSRNDSRTLDRYLENRQQYRIFIDLLMDTAGKLRTLYTKPVSADEKRRGKAAAFRDLEKRFQALKTEVPAFGRFDRWFEKDMNNARFALLSTYHGYIAAFHALLLDCGGELALFYRKASDLETLPVTQRTKTLDSLNLEYAQRRIKNRRINIPDQRR